MILLPEGGGSSSGDVWKPQLPNMLASIVSVHMIQLSSCLLVLLCWLSKLRSFLNWWFWEATSTIWREHLSLEHDVTCFLKKNNKKPHWDEKSCCKSANVHLNNKKKMGRKKYRHWAQDTKQRVWTEARQRLFRKASHLHLMSYFMQYFSGKPKHDRKISLLSDTSWV